MRANFIQTGLRLLRCQTVQKVAKRKYQFLTYGTVDKTLIDRFSKMTDQYKHIFLTYVWIDGTGENVRCKLKVVEDIPEKVSDVPQWHFDGSSTYQATGHDSDMSLAPVAMIRDPFHVGKSKIVLCDVYDSKDRPAKTNHRAKCAAVAEKCKDKEPWFGLEQEYTFHGTDNRPLGFPPEGFPYPQGDYYCSVGANKSAGKNVAEAHLYACMYAGLTVGGTNAEVLMGQWEYQVGPCEGVRTADEIWFSRYILYRVAEEFGIGVTFDPKPVEGDWNGSGAHMNFSTKEMREEGGLKHILAAIEKMRPKHKEHLAAYDPHGGLDNRRRLTGQHETASMEEFTAAEGARNVSIRIPRPVAVAGKGWMEDRRPSANCDPYQVIERILMTCCIE